MRALIHAELRKNWKTHRFLTAFLCFLIFMGCAYSFCEQRDSAYHQEEAQELHYENMIIQPLAGYLRHKIQYTKESQETKELRERYTMWDAAATSATAYAIDRQDLENVGRESLTYSAYRYAQAIYHARTSPYYADELIESSYSLQYIKDQMQYYSYMQKHGIFLYTSPYEPTLANFVVQLFQNETLILLIIIFAFFIIEQICQDFDHGTYKNVYALPYRRSSIMAAKIISAILMLISAFIASILVFGWIPLLEHGAGSLQYPYVVNGTLMTCLPYLGLMVLFTLGVLLFYMAICVLCANVFRNTTNAMLCMSGVLFVVYLCVQMFGMHNPIVTWMPFFYLFPMEITIGSFDYSYLFCMGICIITLAALYILYHKMLEQIDLEGSEAS